MKKIFEQPEVLVQNFAVEDQLLQSGVNNWLAGVDYGPNETNRQAYDGDPISSR